MTIDSGLETITFWETTKNEKYELKGRITSDEEELKKLRYLLTGKKSTEEKSNLEFFGFRIEILIFQFLILKHKKQREERRNPLQRLLIQTLQTKELEKALFWEVLIKK
jgi:hypothetical protein